MRGDIRMEHYITTINIHEVRHLSNISILLNPNQRQHLLITGKNGSGKTSLLQAIQKSLADFDRTIPDSFKDRNIYSKQDKLDIIFNDTNKLNIQYQSGDFIVAAFPADRHLQIIRSQGVEDIRLDEFYEIDSTPGKLLHKYMVHLKTQQAYAKNEEDFLIANKIQKWFERFESALRVLLDDSSVILEYSYREYDFKIIEDGREPCSLDELSDGYSAALHIVSDLILRMDKNWLLKGELSQYDIEGIVLIDELETHLHIELQKKILPFLTNFFPKIQFIITTHSPYILNSIPNAKAYDLEKHVELENLTAYSSDILAEGYFDTDEYSDELRKKVDRYVYLLQKDSPSKEERAERALLRIELKEINHGLFREIQERFEEIEKTRL